MTSESSHSTPTTPPDSPRTPLGAMKRVVYRLGRIGFYTLRAGSKLLPEELRQDLRAAFFETLGRAVPNSRPALHYKAYKDMHALKGFSPIGPEAVQSSFPGYDIFLFPIIDYHFRIQRSQHLAVNLCRAGHKVFYLRISPLTTGEAARQKRRYRLWASTQEPNLFILQLFTERPDPTIYREPMTPKALVGYRRSLDEFLGDVQVKTPVSMVQFPYWVPLAKSLPGLWTLDCLDYIRGFQGVGSAMARQEEDFFVLADAVTASSQGLIDRITPIRPDPVLIRNGAETEYFSRLVRQERTPSTRPVVGYVGSLDHWVDAPLIRQVAEIIPDFDFILIGRPNEANEEILSGLPNLRLLGELEYSKLLDPISRFDVGIIPFKVIELTRCTNPVKVYEYLASGLPVVSTPLPELQSMTDQVLLADGAEEFAQAIRKAVESKGGTDAALRRSSWAARHSWAERSRALTSVWDDAHSPVSLILHGAYGTGGPDAALAWLLRHSSPRKLDLVRIRIEGEPDPSESFRLNLHRQRVSYGAVTVSEKDLMGHRLALGLETALYERVVFLDVRLALTPGWAESLFRHFRLSSGLGLLAPMTDLTGDSSCVDLGGLSFEKRMEQARRLIAEHPQERLPVDSLPPFCLATTKTLLRQIGLPDPDSDILLWGDQLVRRTKEAGLIGAVVGDVFALTRPD